MKVYNGEGIVLGRLGSTVAKQALLGEEVHVVNCEKVIISGAKTVAISRALRRRNLKGHPFRSQTHSRLPDHFVRRSIRGMLPWKNARGKEAFHHIMCYNGIPASFQQSEFIVLSKESKDKFPHLKYITIGEVCKQIGGK